MTYTYKQRWILYQDGHEIADFDGYVDLLDHVIDLQKKETALLNRRATLMDNIMVLQEGEIAELKKALREKEEPSGKT